MSGPQFDFFVYQLSRHYWVSPSPKRFFESSSSKSWWQIGSRKLILDFNCCPNLKSENVSVGFLEFLFETFFEEVKTCSTPSNNKIANHYLRFSLSLLLTSRALSVCLSVFLLLTLYLSVSFWEWKQPDNTSTHTHTLPRALSLSLSVGVPKRAVTHRMNLFTPDFFAPEFKSVQLLSWVILLTMWSFSFSFQALNSYL